MKKEEEKKISFTDFMKFFPNSINDEIEFGDPSKEAKEYAEEDFINNEQYLYRLKPSFTKSK